jgi:hypothetical protein
MPEQFDDKKCPACGGLNLASGTAGVYQHTFIPEGRTMMVGYATRAFVCLSCGFLSHYIKKDDLKEIRSKLKPTTE